MNGHGGLADMQLHHARQIISAPVDAEAVRQAWLEAQAGQRSGAQGDARRRVAAARKAERQNRRSGRSAHKSRGRK